MKKFIAATVAVVSLTCSTVVFAFAGACSKQQMTMINAEESSKQEIVFVRNPPATYVAAEWARNAFLAMGCRECLIVPKPGEYTTPKDAGIHLLIESGSTPDHKGRFLLEIQDTNAPAWGVPPLVRRMVSNQEDARKAVVEAIAILKIRRVKEAIRP